MYHALYSAKIVMKVHKTGIDTYTNWTQKLTHSARLHSQVVVSGQCSNLPSHCRKGEVCMDLQPVKYLQYMSVGTRNKNNIIE